MKSRTNTVSNDKITTTASEDDVPLLDRDTYRKIKKMDRASLEFLIQDIHESGRKKGMSEVMKKPQGEVTAKYGHDLDLIELEKQIKAVKGIGEKRAEEIMEIVEKWLGVR